MSSWEHTPAWTLTEGEERVRALAKTHFGSDDGVVIASAPGRVNLIGEHTDYNGGMAMPIALPHRTFACLTPRDDATLRCVSAQAEHVETLNLQAVDVKGSAGEVNSWAAYVAGVAWAAAKSGLVDHLQGADIAIDSCVPFGAGLSSSAALECAVAAALAEITDTPANSDAERAAWAEVCVRAENEIAGAPTGGLDQAASLRCAAGFALALDCRDGSTRQIPFDLAAHDLTLVVVDTRAEHSLVDGQYAARRADCMRAADLLGVTLLADVPFAQLDAAIGQLAGEPRLAARVRHVVSEIWRTHRFIELLSNDGGLGAQLDELGELMYQSHASLRDDYQVSCPELDTVVRVAKACGAPGARMTGGGFGGSAIALLPSALAADFAAAVQREFAAADFTPPHLYRVEPAAPAAVH